MRKATLLTKDMVPIPVPFVVKNAFGLSALAVLVAFPAMVPIYSFSHGLERLALAHGYRVSIPLMAQFLAAALLCTSVPLLAGFSRTSRFILEVVRFHLDRADAERAKAVAQSLSYQVWYRDYKNNEWFRRFLETSGLESQDARYAGFKRKLGPLPRP